jgi:serine/threonine protein phosphatase PrpC
MSELYKPSQAMGEVIEILIRLVGEANFPVPDETEHATLIQSFDALQCVDRTKRIVATQTLLVFNKYWAALETRNAAISNDISAGAVQTVAAMSSFPDEQATTSAEENGKVEMPLDTISPQTIDGDDNSIQKDISATGVISGDAKLTENDDIVSTPASATPLSVDLESVSTSGVSSSIDRPSEQHVSVDTQPNPSDAGQLVPDAVVRIAPGVVAQARPLEARKVNIHLKNARVGDAYQSQLGVNGFKEIKLEGDGGTGLVWDDATATISGNVEQAGDFKLVFRGLRDGYPIEVVASLAVIPDPKSLWVSKPSDEEDEYWKPDESFDKFDGEIFCAAASKRGRSHARDGGYREDDFGLKTLGDGSWHIAAVADGAGSAKFSRRGSKIAVDTVLAGLPELLDTHVSPNLEALVHAFQGGNSGAEARIKQSLYSSLAQSAFNAAKAIEAEANAKLCEPTAYYTTLIIGVCKKTAAGWFFATFAIGDGGAAVFSLPDATIKPMILPDGGEFAGQTRFLQCSEFAGTYEDIAKRLFFDIREDFTAFLLMTDGITDPKFPTDVVFADQTKWAEFWREDFTKYVEFEPGNAELKQEFLNWMDFWSPGNHDDRTLAVMVP